MKRYRQPSDKTVLKRLGACWAGRDSSHDAEGTAWYDTCRATIADIVATSPHWSGPEEHAVFAFAAVSPMVTYSQNCDMLRKLVTFERFRNCGTFPRVARDGWACLHGKIERCTGPKRHAFARAILGDVSAVVLDRWMLRIVRHPSPSLTPKQYRRYADLLTRFADSVGVTPRECQAILWCAIRNDVTPMSDTNLLPEVPF